MSQPKTIEPDADVGQVLFQAGVEHPQRSTCPACGDRLDTIAIADLAYVFETCRCDQVEYDHLYEQFRHRRCLTEAPVDGLDAAFVELERVIGLVPDGWHFDRLEHQHDSSGSWRARAVYTSVHPREIVAEYGRRPDVAVADLSRNLERRYQVAPIPVRGTSE